MSDSADLGELVERLRRKTYTRSMCDVQEPVNPDGPAAADAIESLSERLRAAEGALRPFAEAYDQFCPEGPDSHRIDTDDGITLGHLRAARAALSLLPVGGKL